MNESMTVLKEKLKIKCIGFSVTGYGSPSYPVLLKEKLSENYENIDVEYMSVGGLSIDSLAPLLRHTEKNKLYDILILELSTSWFSLRRNNSFEADPYISDIHSFATSLAKKVIYLNLYRRDIDDEDQVVDAIKRLCGHEASIIDLKKKYRQMLIDFEDDGTTDGVHPKQKTIQDIVGNLISQIISLPMITETKKTEITSFPRELIVGNLTNLYNKSFNNNHGLCLITYKISVPSSILVDLGQSSYVDGVFFEYGPDTTSARLTLNDEIINVPMYDENSFYRRLGYRYFGKRQVKNIKIDALVDRPSVELRRQPWELTQEKCCYIVGFSSCGV